MAEVEWTGDTTIRLMEMYKLKPELWDSTHDLYRVQTAKYEAWSDLARIFECDIADLRKKLNSIFASHRREKAKIRGGGRSTWFLYDHMSFLPSHVDNVETHPSSQRRQQSEESEDTTDDETNDDAHQTEILIKQEPQFHEKTTRKQSRVESRHIGPKLQRITRPLLRRRLVHKDKDNGTSANLDSKLLETLRLLRKSDLSKKKDECDTFGDYIAVSLRKHDDRTQSMIKQAINNILFEQEMKKYSSGQYSVLISGVDENPLILGDDK